jgi:glycerol uptake facilitator-like aquaporin
MKKCAAEFVATFALVFAGTGAIIINETSGGALRQLALYSLSLVVDACAKKVVAQLDVSAQRL